VVVGLADVFDGFAFPALLSLLMVALVALARGMAPSLLATLVAAILLGALLHSTVPHLSENTEGRVVALALFLVAGGALSALAGRVERARRAAQLLARVAEQGRQDARIEAGRLDTVIDAMTNGLLVYDRDGRIMRTNRAARAILGFDAQSDAVAGPPHEWAARDAQGRPLTEERWGLPRILRGEKLTGADAIEMQVRVLDGREVRISASGAPLRDPAGHISGAVMVVQDVTELRRLERRTRESLQALLTMAETLVTSPLAAPADAAAPRPDKREGDLPVARRLAAVARRVLDCRRVGIIALDGERLRPVTVAGDTVDAERDWWAGVAAFAPHARLDSRWATRLRAGEVMEIDLTRPPFRDLSTLGARAVLVAPLRVDDSLIGVLTVDVEDHPRADTADERALTLAVAQLAAVVLERARLQGARAEAARLAALDHLRGEFVATVSHELQTPLTAVRAGLGLLETGLDGGLGPAERELLAATRRNVERLRLRIDDLLAANRLEAGALRPDRAPLDLRRTVTAALAAIRPLLQEKGQEVTLDLPTPLPVAGDGDLLEQVVVNLLANANRHTPRGTRIAVAGRVAPDEVRLAVRDDGPGIPPADLETVFDPFRRLGGAAGRSGSGLGLSIARRVVALHGGRLWAESGSDPDGAIFTVALPRDATGDER